MKSLFDFFPKKKSTDAKTTTTTSTLLKRKLAAAGTATAASEAPLKKKAKISTSIARAVVSAAAAAPADDVVTNGTTPVKTKSTLRVTSHAVRSVTKSSQKQKTSMTNNNKSVKKAIVPQRRLSASTNSHHNNDDNDGDYQPKGRYFGDFMKPPKKIELTDEEKRGVELMRERIFDTYPPPLDIINRHNLEQKESNIIQTDENDESVNDNDNRDTPKYPVGTRVRKSFPGHGWFRGKVVSYDETFYSIRYEDGDQEEMSEGELACVLSDDDDDDDEDTPATKAQIPEAKHPEKERKSVSSLKRSVIDNPVSSSSLKTRNRRATPKKPDVVDRIDDDDEDDYKPENAGNMSSSEDQEENLEASSSSDEEFKSSAKVLKRQRIARSSTSNASPKAKPKSWGFLDGKVAKPKPVRKIASKKKKSEGSGGASSGSGKVNRNPYTAGDDLPIISHPQDMFDDMIKTKLTDNGKHPEILMPLLKTLMNRPLRVATMCSGTESPILALDMLTKSIEELARTNEKFKDLLKQENISLDRIFQIEHVFSCEIEPFKQAYIERNFHPPLLFRDIRELGNDMAYTAYGALVPVPNNEGDVDLLVAGTSCVDYSNLNNKQKTIDQAGESGQTFFGMINWIEKAKPPLIIIENVYGAPWPTKVKLFEERGYSATYLYLDTKDMYIPHTRQRGYLLAVKTKNGKTDSKIVDKWKEQLGKLKRPASAALDAFMLSNDDPRVLHGRARLMASNDASGEGGSSRSDRTGRVDWTKCETRHQACRASEELGDKRPLTGWSESSSTVVPCFGGNWNDWVNQQVHRIHDLMDVNTLRMAQVGMDCTFKTMVWNLSQNVDRDTMGKLGLCQCLTPTGVPYVTNRGGPLVGEELLLLQGIPADDLLLTKESEDNLKDLAGNAMSTTVVGACMLSALVLGHALLGPIRATSSAAGRIVPSLVPRALLPETDIKITKEFGRYEERDLELGRRSQDNFVSLELLRKEADSSARKCTSEGSEESFSYDRLMICRACGHTTSEACALPPRKFEEHEFIKMSNNGLPRLQPSAFRKKLLAVLPMRVHFKGISKNVLEKPGGVDVKLWNAWINSLLNCVAKDDNTGRSLTEFRFTELKRTHVWTAEFVSVTGGKLNLRIDATEATWFLFAKRPNERGPLRDALDRPLAKMVVMSQTSELSLLKGVWEFCLPSSIFMEVSIKGVGNLVDSWRSKLGLRGNFADEKRYEKLDVSVIGSDQRVQAGIGGVYSLLSKCGTACGSLYKRSCLNECMYFFLESGRCNMPDNDAFVFSKSKHRTSYQEYRDVFLQIDPNANFRPIVKGQVNQSDWRVKAITPGKWVSVACVSLADEREGVKGVAVKITVPSSNVELVVPVATRSWTKCPEVVSCQVPLSIDDPLLMQCLTCESALELNLQKSKRIFQDLAFVLSRFSIPDVFAKRDDESWLVLDSSACPREYNEELPCKTCAPDKPGVRWAMITKANTQRYVPIEDGKEAAAYEMALKNRPNPWVIRFTASDRSKNEGDSIKLTLRIGCNAVSLVQRALGLLPPRSAPRRVLIENAKQTNEGAINSVFDWRIVYHEEKSISQFPRLKFQSNKRDQQALQPPNFKRYGLRVEQLRSLRWMLCQEASSDPFWEEEVAEAILPNLCWRAEGRVRRPVLVRGGIIADEVGYGKTAITLGLVDASNCVNGPPPGLPEDFQMSYFFTKATLIIVPSHLMGQWPQEIKKFLGSSKKVCVLNNMSSFNNLTIGDVRGADIVVVNFTVLCNESYFLRLFRLGGVDPDSVGAKGGRHFDAVYDKCLKNLEQRVSQLQTECSTVYKIIENAADENNRLRDNNGEAVRLDRKKTLYKKETSSKSSSTTSKAKSSKESGPRTGDRDPWGLSISSVQRNVEKLKCPPLELFYWNRIVIDEFTYLSKSDRSRVLSLVLRLRSSFRWCLSGTPPHAHFDDIQSLANLLQTHLGVDDTLPGSKLGGRKKSDERTGLENLSLYLEVRSLQWHERRHSIAQNFLDRFVRQNIAEIDEIPCEEHVVLVNLSSAERAVYTELDTHLKSLDMNNRKALKSKIGSRGDRETRMQQALEGAGCAEEALLKRCAYFDSSTLKDVYEKRQRDKISCEEELKNSIAAALRQRGRILAHQPDWTGMKLAEKGEVQDQLELYINSVEKNESVSGGADDEVHDAIKKLLMKARTIVAQNPRAMDPEFAEANGDKNISVDSTETLVAEESEDSDDEAKASKKRKLKKPLPETKAQSTKPRTAQERLYDMKFALRNHMHKVRHLGKELCARIRSFRFLESLISFQDEGANIRCSGGPLGSCPYNGRALDLETVGAFTLCGHVGCLPCLQKHAESNECIERCCKAQVQHVHIVPAKGFVEVDEVSVTHFGSKLSAIVDQVKEVVDKGDRVIVFVQFDDLKQKVASALLERNVQSLQVKGAVQQQVKALTVLQKEKPDKKDPKVILLKMDDETSAGVNLTTCNHAVFVHPLLAATRQEYDAYETQAIGRIRRYGQTKKVHIWRFLARNTIDTEIFVDRSGCSLSEVDN